MVCFHLEAISAFMRRKNARDQEEHVFAEEFEEFKSGINHSTVQDWFQEWRAVGRYAEENGRC